MTLVIRNLDVEDVYGINSFGSLYNNFYTQLAEDGLCLMKSEVTNIMLPIQLWPRASSAATARDSSGVCANLTGKVLQSSPKCHSATGSFASPPLCRKHSVDPSRANQISELGLDKQRVASSHKVSFWGNLLCKLPCRAFSSTYKISVARTLSSSSDGCDAAHD